MIDSLRRSFKSHGSHKYSNSKTTFSDNQEEQPILRDGPDDHAAVSVRPLLGEVVVKVDDAGNAGEEAAAPSNNAGAKIWREPSYVVWKEVEAGRDGSAGGKDRGGGSSDRGGEFSFKNRNEVRTTAAAVPDIAEDPPSRLIRGFLHQQRASGSESPIDMLLEMEELRSLPPSNSASKDLGFSFHPRSSRPCTNSSSSSMDGDDQDNDVGASQEDEFDRDRSNASPKPMSRKDAGVGSPEVVLCTSSAAFQCGSTLLRAKTRSRLMDPLPAPAATSVAYDDGKKSGRIRVSNQLRSGVLKSGFIGKSQRIDEDDEDPFVDEDVPDELKRAKFGWLAFFQWLGFVLIFVALILTLSISTFRRKKHWELELWKWEILVLVLICGRLVSGWVIRLAVFLIERNFVLRKRVLYFVYGVRKAVQNCIWLGLATLSWHCMLDKKLQRKTKSNLHYVSKVLFCLLVATLFWLIKTLLLKVLASSFHVSTYFDRIQEAVFNQYVIETLSGPPVIEIQAAQEEEDRVVAEMKKIQSFGIRIPSDLKAAALQTKSGASPLRKIGKSIRLSHAISNKEGEKQQDEGITIEKLSKLNQKNVSAWNMKRLMRIVRYGTLSTLDEQISAEYGEDESAMHIRSEYEAKIAAKKIFHNVACPGSKYICLTDLMRFMRDDDAVKTMSLFEGAQEKKRVSRRALKNWVVNAFKDRRALSLTLNDTKTAVNKLHQMVNVVVGILVLGIWLLIVGIATIRFFVLLGSQLLLVVFVFGNTLKMVFEALIFLFVMHPFDVGDRCEIGGVQMFVEEMNIMTTVFLRYDNQKISYPNSVLATMPIGNFYRSPDMGDSIDFCVHVATPVEKLAAMRDRIIRFMENKKEHWYPNPSVVLRDVDDMNRLKISIWMRHRINFQDMGMRWTRRELVVEEMIKVLKELDIEYRMLPLDVNVHNMPTITSSRLPSTWKTFN